MTVSVLINLTLDDKMYVFFLSAALEQFVYIINQLLHDLEERLVFRTNVYFERELLGYIPSPGDLAYPEKLEQMEVYLLLFFFCFLLYALYSTLGGYHF